MGAVNLYWRDSRVTSSRTTVVHVAEAEIENCSRVEKIKQLHFTHVGSYSSIGYHLQIHTEIFPGSTQRRDYGSKKNNK